MQTVVQKQVDVADMAAFCKENVSAGHLSYVLPFCAYPELYEALQLGESAFDYGNVRKYITHAQAVEAIQLKIKLGRLYLAHTCYLGSTIFHDTTIQRKREVESGIKHHKAIMLSAAMGFDVYDYAILVHAASEDEIEALLSVSDYIKWYAQLRLVHLSHSSIMECLSKKLSLEAIWHEHNTITDKVGGDALREVKRRFMI